MSSVAFSPLHVACCQLSVAHLPVVVCGIADRWIVSACTFSVARRTFSVACGLRSAVACPSVPCRMVCAVCRLVPRRIPSRCTLHDARSLSHGVRCLLPGPRRVSSRCMCCVARRRSHVACCTPPAASCRLAVACPILACRLPHAVRRPLQSGAAPSHTQRIAAASLAGEPRCSADRGVRARVRACVRACVRDGVLLCVRREDSCQRAVE